MTETRLSGERAVLRSIREDDRPRLAEILAEPSVAQWWGTGGGARPVAELYDGDLASRLAIEVDGKVVGFIQYEEEDDVDYRHAGIDLFVERAYQGRGIGSDALRTLARHLFETRGHHRLTIDPALGNEHAIAVYGRVGFRPVGVMRLYERGIDGTWHDGLLMDMLTGELT
jgi:aminoglycoside 6'-N-acetyltransferase